MRRSAFFGVCLLFLLGSIGCGTESRWGCKSYQQAPDFTLTPLNRQNQKTTLSEIAKERPVLLVFWATWCSACVSEIPTLNEWYDKYRDRGLEILAINIQESPDYLLQFMAKNPIRYPTLIDEQGEIASRYGLVGLPASVFLAKGGKIIYYGFGLPPNVEQLLTQS